MKVLRWKSKSVMWLTKSKKHNFADGMHAEDELKTPGEDSMVEEIDGKDTQRKAEEVMDGLIVPKKMVSRWTLGLHETDKDSECLHDDATPVHVICLKQLQISRMK